MEECARSGKHRRSHSLFVSLFVAAHQRWMEVQSVSSNTPEDDFRKDAGYGSTRAVQHWIKNGILPPETKWPRTKGALAKQGNTAAQIAELDRAWRGAQGLPPLPEPAPEQSPPPGNIPAITQDTPRFPAPWYPADDHYRRVDGFADIDAHPPDGETADGAFALRVSATLGTYDTQVPDAPDGQQGFPVSLSVTGRVEVVIESKGGVQRVPGSEHVAAAADMKPKISFAGGAFSIDVSEAPDPAKLLTDRQLCEMRRYQAGGQVEVDLRCLPSAIHVDGIPKDLPTTAQAVLRRLHQFADANTENDRIVLAWSRIQRRDT